jgi:hypothetical protein
MHNMLKISHLEHWMVVQPVASRAESCAAWSKLATQSGFYFA